MPLRTLKEVRLSKRITRVIVPSELEWLAQPKSCAARPLCNNNFSEEER